MCVLSCVYCPFYSVSSVLCGLCVYCLVKNPCVLSYAIYVCPVLCAVYMPCSMCILSHVFYVYCPMCCICVLFYVASYPTSGGEFDIHFCNMSFCAMYIVLSHISCTSSGRVSIGITPYNANFGSGYTCVEHKELKVSNINSQ